jgi:hypothetical protein
VSAPATPLVTRGSVPLLVVVGAVMAVVAITLAIRRPVHPRLFAGTGLEEWRIRAARLS